MTIQLTAVLDIALTHTALTDAALTQTADVESALTAVAKGAATERRSQVTRSVTVSSLDGGRHA